MTPCKPLGTSLARVGVVVLVALALVLASRPSEAQPLSAALRIPAPDAGLSFGGAVAGHNNKIAVGPGFVGGGGVEVYDGTAGGIITVLINPTLDDNDSFGAAVAWVGDDVLVGAPRADIAGTDRGAAYLFDGTTGNLLHTFTRPQNVDGWFGYAVGGNGNEAIVGVIGLLGPNGEGAYRFDATTGASLGAFADPNAGTPNAGRFGETITVDGGDVIISSSYGASAVYRFDATGNLLQTYQDPEPNDSDEFGAATAVSGTHLAVGAGTSGGGGRVYLFDLATGTLQHTYTAPFVSDSLFFDLALAGVANALEVGSNDGVFVYETTPPYDLIQTVYAPIPYADDRDVFGRALGDLDGALLVGAFHSAYLFDVCGNGKQSAREQCDDGNLTDGDGCSSSCRLETCGAMPASGCVMATKSALQVRDENSIFGLKDGLKWSWLGPVTDLSTFGDPLTSSDVVLCVWDLASSPTPRLRMQPAALAGGFCGVEPCWHGKDGRAFAYQDKFLTPSGIEKLKLVTGGSGTKASIIGKGPDLGVPTGAGQTVGLAGQVTVQLRSTTSSTCLQADYPAPARNAKGTYKDSMP